jgi:molybdopterin-binding protein
MKKISLKIGALTLMLMLTLPVFSQVTLKYNLKKGEIFKQNISTNMDLTQKVMSQEMKINLNITANATFEVKDVKGANYTLEMKYKEVKMNMKMPGMDNLSFDSNTPEDIATLQDFGPILKAIVDKPVEIVLTETGKVESIKGADKLGEAMLNSLDTNIPDATKQQLISQFGSQFSEEYFKMLFSQNAGYFSDKPVNTGDSWNYKTSTTSSNITMNIDMNMTVKSIDDNTVTLDIEGTVVTPEKYETEINGMKAKVTIKGSQKGWVKIDKNTGWIVSSKITQDTAGDMEVMEMNIPMSIKSTISVSDK